MSFIITDLVRHLVQSYPELLVHEDRAGRSPLHYAAVIRDGGHLYKILTKAGADPSVTDRVRLICSWIIVSDFGALNFIFLILVVLIYCIK